MAASGQLPLGQLLESFQPGWVPVGREPGTSGQEEGGTMWVDLMPGVRVDWTAFTERGTLHVVVTDRTLALRVMEVF